MNCNDSKLGVKPKKNINPKKGIKDKPRLINEDKRDEIGNINVGIFIDFKILELETTETKT